MNWEDDFIQNEPSPALALSDKVIYYSSMNEQERAAQNLEVIRSMMERATVYRMISGPTALFAGVLALLVAWFESSFYAKTWLSIWYGVALSIMIFNTILVLLKAKREETTVFSPGLMMGLRAIIPPLLIGFFIGAFAPTRSYDAVLLSWIWMLCYGVALMSTVNFAPRSIWVLGSMFLVSGLYCFYRWPTGTNDLDDSLLMAITFGGYHLLYGLYVIFIENKRS